MPNRRHVLAALAAGPLLAPRSTPAVDFPLPLTPSCGDRPDLTRRQTEGPYFAPNSPQKHDFAADAPGGVPITIAGLVLTADCRPVPHALVELWHADENGIYDNEGYRLRGHQFADTEGRWWFQTIVPGLYPGRTRHYHLKVQRPGADLLTTQLYFPGEPGNARDRIFDEALLLDFREEGFARYDFVVA